MLKKIKVVIMVIALCLSSGVYASAYSFVNVIPYKVPIKPTLPAHIQPALELSPLLMQYYNTLFGESELSFYNFSEPELQLRMEVSTLKFFEENVKSVRVVGDNYTAEKLSHWQNLLQPDAEVVLRMDFIKWRTGSTRIVEYVLSFADLLAVLRGEAKWVHALFSDEVVLSDYILVVDVVFYWADGLGLIRSNVIRDTTSFQGNHSYSFVFFTRLSEFEAWSARMKWLQLQESAGITRDEWDTVHVGLEYVFVDDVQ